MKRLAWRGINRPNAWFHHPRAFWTIETSRWVHKVSLRRRWYMAIHDPLYVGLWVAMFIIIGTVVGLVA